MWSIAICDDNKEDCHMLGELLDVYCQEKKVAMEWELFYDGISLYREMSLGKRFDLIFLDVLMLEMDGIRLGEEIRTQLNNEEVELVYMSYGLRDAEAVMENRPMKFLRKPFRRKRVFYIVDYARRLGFCCGQQFLFQKNNVYYQVPYEEILYFQSCGRKVEIHMINENSEFYGKLSDILERGLPKQFVQIHQSYIVNKDFIAEFKADRVYLRGEKGYFSISRTFRRSAVMRLKKLLMAEFD